MVEILKQGQYQPLSVEKQIVIIFVGINEKKTDLQFFSLIPTKLNGKA